MILSRLRFYYLAHALLAFCVLSSSSFAAPPGWKLVWKDEFEGKTPDTSKWELIDWTTPHNNERQAYHPSRVTVANGNLVLTADDADYGGKTYTSGKVVSRLANQHGRWEVRAKLPGTQGTWPAIWLLPDTKKYAWPSQGEIDIMENRGHQPNMTSSAFHYGIIHKDRDFTLGEQRTSELGKLNNYHDNFHVYAVEWDAKQIRFYVDNVHHFTVDDASTDGFISKMSAPMQVQLNVAVGGIFLYDAQPDDDSRWPQQMLVDYVRVYEPTAKPQPIIFRNGGFETDGGSIAFWSTFGNTLVANPNVQVHNEAVAEGAASLKLFGQFNGTTNYSGVSQGISVSPGDSVTAQASSIVRSSDSISDTSNTVLMKIEYYSDFGGAHGSPEFLSEKQITIADGSTANDVWGTHRLTDTVPESAVEARLALVFVQNDDQGGSIHVDNVQLVNSNKKLDEKTE